MRFVVVLLSLSFLVGGAAHASSSRTGLYGVVTRGPITPVCVAEQPCTEPAVGAVVVFSRAGRDIGRTTVGTRGWYRIRLAAGPYSVRTLQRPIEPTSTRVRSGRMMRVNFSIDTGVR
jgi:hypothetical protein